MRTVVRKWGNSASVRIPAAVMQAAHLDLDEAVDVREEPGRLQREDESYGLLPDDDADQELSLRGGDCRGEPKRGSGRSGQEPRLAEKPGQARQAQRDDIGG